MKASKHSISWIFGIILIVIGVLNILFVHAIPGIVYILLSCIYIPPACKAVTETLNITLPDPVKVVIGFMIIWFTLGVSDLTEMIRL